MSKGQETATYLLVTQAKPYKEAAVAKRQYNAKLAP
jgi:hypothetical protein